MRNYLKTTVIATIAIAFATEGMTEEWNVSL